MFAHSTSTLWRATDFCGRIRRTKKEGRPYLENAVIDTENDLITRECGSPLSAKVRTPGRVAKPLNAAHVVPLTSLSVVDSCRQGPH